jgi:hypothetical protein
MKVKANIYDALKSLLSCGSVSITFTKRDGTERVMKCTNVLADIPEERRPIGESTFSENKDIIRVYDIESEGWRSFRVDSVKSFDILPLE